MPQKYVCGILKKKTILGRKTTQGYRLSAKVSLTSLFLIILYFGFYNYMLSLQLQEGSLGDFPARMSFCCLNMDSEKVSGLHLGSKYPGVVSRGLK